MVESRLSSITFTLVLVLAVVVVAAAVIEATTVQNEPVFYDLNQAEQLWQEWLVNHGKRYVNGVEQRKRFLTFRENLALINELNRNRANNDDDTIYGLTQFSDLTPEEFQNTILMQHSPQDVARALQESNVNAVKLDMSENDLRNIPDEFDWRNEKGVVGEPRDQGLCGSCWAFSAVGNIESVYAIRKGQYKTVSPQQMIECDARNCACHGGWMHKAYDWVVKNGGIAAESDYPYCVPPHGKCFVCNAPGTTMEDCPLRPDYCNATCHDAEPFIKITGWEKLDSEDEDEIAAYLIKKGPLAIAVNANWWAFYRKGISNPIICSGDRLNHAVLLVGYGQQKTAFGGVKKFWIIRNSWGSKWGENGYIRLARGTGKCGCNRYILTAKVD